MPQIELVKGDITQLKVDAIVNAANRSLLGGGGVDGAIHRAAGPELLVECKTLNGCQTGKAKITSAYLLNSKYIIHTVGPIWQGGHKNEAQLLGNCYNACLQLASDNDCYSIAFPNISTGVYGYPKQEAAGIAIREVQSFLKSANKNFNVYFICYDDENYRIYQSDLEQFRL